MNVFLVTTAGWNYSIITAFLDEEKAREYIKKYNSCCSYENDKYRLESYEIQEVVNPVKTIHVGITEDGKHVWTEAFNYIHDFRCFDPYENLRWSVRTNDVSKAINEAKTIWKIINDNEKWGDEEHLKTYE